MKKIPVGQVIAETYRFTFAGLEKVIALVWLPTIVLTVADYFAKGAYLPAMAAALETGDNSQLGPTFAAQLGFAVFTLIVRAVIAVAICREILAPLKRPLFLRFSLGRMELRVVGAMFGLGALMVLAVVLCMIAGTVLGGTIAGSAGGVAPAQVAFGMAILIGVVVVPLLIYVFMRLGALLVPAAVVEGGLGLERSWALLKGNVWRMIGVSLAVSVPAILVLAVVQGLAMGSDSVGPTFDSAGGMPALFRYMAITFRQTAAHLPLLEGLDFIVAPFFYGLIFSAPAFAYKALAETITPAAIGSDGKLG
jgi:hypothetical protein